MTRISDFTSRGDEAVALTDNILSTVVRCVQNEPLASAMWQRPHFESELADARPLIEALLREQLIGRVHIKDLEYLRERGIEL